MVELVCLFLVECCCTLFDGDALGVVVILITDHRLCWR